jgi:hypothetical protein
MTAGCLRTAPRAAARRFCRSVASWMWLAGLIAGCASRNANLVECPLSIDQQRQAVLEIVPRGTSRDDAERRLKAAGIEFTPGGNGSIYYLALWNREDGQRWHIDVALLFDPSGKLYQTRAANASTEAVADDSNAARQGRTAKARDDSPRGESAPADADDVRVPFTGPGGPR